ncbi:MAG: peptide chain release factor N(5)-glutamine methyltransferase [Opitutaceae bacterium]|nr:peptide chain release factor N(5)-glutamine methyltransferase [Opitutaceae bacterium]
MTSLLEIVKKSTEYLASKGVENARFNAEWLIGHALGLQRMQLYMQFERLLLEPELEKVRPLLRRRAAHEPLQYILGETLFAGLRLKCDRRALIPRPETEYLVELIVSRCKDTPPAHILDLGTGTGALALALASVFPAARVIAVDQSEDALALAGENAALNGLADRVECLKSDWFSNVAAGSSFSLIVSNPPYLAEKELTETLPEVREFEPHAALVAGGDGLDDLRSILRRAAEYLSEGGILAMETGIGQHAELKKLAMEAGFPDCESVQDLTGRDRYVFLRAGN